MEDESINKGPKKTHPSETASTLSKLFFCWSIPLFYKRYKKKETRNQTFESLRSHDSQFLGDKLEVAWETEATKSNPSLRRALWMVFRFEIIGFAFLFIVVEFVLKMSQPLLIGRLMGFYSSTKAREENSETYICSSLILLTCFLNVLIAHYYLLGVLHLGMKLRIACCSLIYRKSLQLNRESVAKITIGKLINLQSNDVNRFDAAPMHLIQLFVAPLETLTIIVLIYLTVGWTATAGIVFLLMFVPVQMYMGKLAGVYRARVASRTDIRVKLVNEIVSGIHVIKMYAWEKPFGRMVKKARRLEIEQIRIASYLKALNVSFMVFMNRTGIFLCILLYVLTQTTRLDAKYVFVVTTFYANLRQVLTVYLPFGLNNVGETKISIERIQEFLLTNGKENKEVTYIPTEIEGKLIQSPHEKPERTENKIGINLQGVYVKSNESFLLNNVNVKFHCKELCAVIGTVGAGKSCLLHAILGEFKPVKGKVDVSGRISYASQEPWLFNASVKQNILFGSPLDQEKYSEILQICALKSDISSLPFGDKTLVGDRGMMLSGGQKSRINLARALYKEADIYLLDDPLSALDTKVGNAIFRDCIKEFLKDKCVVLVTNQLRHLGDVDTICLIEKGRITATGNLGEIKSEKWNEIPRSVDVSEALEQEAQSSAPKVFKEHTKLGKIQRDVHREYLKAGGHGFHIFILFLLFVFTQSAGSGADYFTAFWVDLEQRSSHAIFTTKTCAFIYISIIIGGILITITRSMDFFWFCTKASIGLHNQMFFKIVRAPIRFFDQNSSGVILNRFSKDMGTVDEILPSIAMDTIGIAFSVTGVILVISFINPLILLPTFFILAIFYVFRIIFLATSRNLKRMEASSRSPVFSHITASLEGLSTIRAFGVQKKLKDEFDAHQNAHSSAAYLFLSCNRAFGFWLDMNCVCYIITVVVVIILSETFAGEVGLAITQAISLTGVVQFGIRQWSELENQMTSVERIVEYIQIEPEAKTVAKLKNPNWPSDGKIEFNSVSLQYSLEGPNVLRKINITINPREKIGIVGRTGAGKSSLVSTLFRLVRYKGNIAVDGVDIESVPLKTLRRNISIIPQDPVLFSGSLRDNLDPFGMFEDSKLWNVLDQVKMKHLLLDSQIAERGSNLSVGQKHLVCLARAVLRNNKIFIMDEATANVDSRTDYLIQNVIKEIFKDCTILTIAHRLNTVMDSDRVLVMDEGRVVEFDAPYKLACDKNSKFYQFLREAGREMEENLIKIAAEAYEKKSS